MSVTRIANRYAKSLIELAEEQGKLHIIVADVEAVRKALTNRDFFNLLKSPIVKHDKKQKIFDLIFVDRLDELSKVFFNTLTRKGREAFIPEIAEEFISMYKRSQKITTIELTSAVNLSEEVLDQIRAKLEVSSETFENVEIQHKVDPSIIGGFVMEFENKLYDASVLHHLEELKKEFTTSNS